MLGEGGLFLPSNEAADYLQHTGHTARHGAIGEELTRYTHSRYTIDLVCILQLCCPCRFAANSEGFEHGAEFGFIYALLD